MWWLAVLAVVWLTAGTGWLWWDGRMRYGPMTGARHRRYLADLHRRAVADAEHVRALSALTTDDLAWLKLAGWVEPPHATYVRLNRLDV